MQAHQRHLDSYEQEPKRHITVAVAARRSQAARQVQLADKATHIFVAESETRRESSLIRLHAKEPSLTSSERRLS